MKACFVPKRFNAKFQKLIPVVEAIMTTYAEKGYNLTVRQLHYRLVAANTYLNTFRNYKMLVGLLTTARLAGILDWDIIVDRARRTVKVSAWDSLADFLADVKLDFRLNKWNDQECYVECMVEKDALSGVLSRVCDELEIAFTANKGYNSSSGMWKTARRFRHWHDRGKRCVLLYLGDHDPSGMDMTRDVEDRLRLLAGDPVTMDGERIGNVAVPLELEIQRVALNVAQVEQYRPPENFIKEVDSRTPGYRARFGEHCWELDALDPDVMNELVREEVLALRDHEKWDAYQRKQETQAEKLEKFIKRINRKRK